MSFTFNISLSILNHLGRNLYRNFITVIGEAISNSWDADAHNVWIDIDKENGTMYIVDDGLGMTEDDFQNKFLKIGYSKRISKSSSTLNRPYIGRKGIGKLALLSCASRVHIASKAGSGAIVGGLIDNSGLDKAISDDISANNYPLEDFSPNVAQKLSNLHSGTAIYFDNIKDGVYNTIEYLRKVIALYFRFSLIDNTFVIHLNGSPITMNELNELAESTQFVWQINSINDPFLKEKISPSINESIRNYTTKESRVQMKGFIATTRKPSDLKIRSTNEKVSLDLFVNGRLREKDLLKHIPTTRIVESYIYGQIHYNDLDYNKDAFTSSREGIISDDPVFKTFLVELNIIIRSIIEEWDKLRLINGNDGDPDNPNLSRKTRKAKELFNETVNDIIPKDIMPRKGIVESWVSELGNEAQFNIPSYTECFISENLLRKYVEHKQIPVTDEAMDTANKWKVREDLSKNVANISIQIRQNNSDLQYLDMNGLSNLVDKPEDPIKQAGIARDAKSYKPVRDAVCHTSLLTQEAKNHLSGVFANIQARLRTLLKQ
jgi:hypothetical protein